MKFKESSHLRLIEQVSPEGKEWDVLIIKSGLSMNKCFYPKEVLQKAKHLFEDCKVFAYEFTGSVKKMYDHLPDKARQAVPQGFVQNLVGWLENVRWDEDQSGLVARLHISENAKGLRDLLKDAWQHGKKILGLSIDARGEASAQFMNGQQIRRVDSIDVVNSTDVVSYPAAGGQMLRLVASQNFTEENMERLKALLKLLKESRPTWLEGFSFENASDEDLPNLMTQMIEANLVKATDFLAEAKQPQELQEVARGVSSLKQILGLIAEKKFDEAMKLIENWVAVYPAAGKDAPKFGFYSFPYGDKDNKGYPDLLKAYEGVKASDRSSLASILSLIASGKHEEAKGLIEKMKEAKPPADDKGKAKDPAVTKLTESVTDLTNKVELSECKVTLAVQLKESKLPQLTQDKIETMYAGKVFKSEELKTSIDGERDYLAKINKSSGDVLTGGTEKVEMGKEKKDKLQEAVDGMIEGVDVNKTPRFKSIHKAFKAVTGVSDPNPQKILVESCFFANPTIRDSLKESLVTTDWAQILGDSITRQMVKMYSLPGLSDWRKLCSDIGPVKDFRTNRRTRLGGYGELPGVAQGDPYGALTSPGDEEATYAVSKKGGTEDFTLEMAADDDLQALKQIPVRLGRAAAQTIYRAVLGIMPTNAAIYDAVVLFHAATHKNLGTNPLSDAALTAAKVAMMDQAAYGDAKEILGMSNIPKWLVVPNELEKLSFQLTRSKVDVTSNADATIPNLHSEYGLEPIVVPFYTDANDWFAVANPQMIPTIEVGFLHGQEEPELFVQDMANVGSVFSNDKITYKIRHIYGIVVLDYRGFYGAHGI